MNNKGTFILYKTYMILLIFYLFYNNYACVYGLRLTTIDNGNSTYFCI